MSSMVIEPRDELCTAPIRDSPLYSTMESLVWQKEWLLKQHRARLKMKMILNMGLLPDKLMIGKNNRLIEINLYNETVYRPYRFGSKRL
jgi:hypothetical protein